MKNNVKMLLNSICIYKGLFEDGIGKLMSELIENLSTEDNLNNCLKAYNNFTYGLFEKNKILSFKEVMIENMLLSHNPFNVTLEKKGEVPDFITEGLKKEFKYLEYILNLKSTDIKKILKNIYGKDKDDNKRIDDLIDWGIEESKYKAQNNTDFSKLKEKLIHAKELKKFTEEIALFHKKNGTGRAPAYSAFVWERFESEEEGHLREILEPDPIRLSELVGYESQKEEIIKNTENFLKGVAANNLLLYGSRGTGKSSTVKAILNEYSEDGLRIIEVDKEQLSDFTRIIRLLRHKKQKFIIFVDDLVFAENEASYSALKTILEGRIENRPSNILIYATTNRRHLVQEKFSDRDEVHSKDTREEKLSLSDRFGITISFFQPNQKEFLDIVDGIVDVRKIVVDREYLHSEALKWEKWHNGRSPRSARQFVDWLEGEI